MKLLKRILVLLLVLFASLVVVNQFDITTYAAITTFGNIFTNPGEDCNTEMNIMYQLPKGTTGSYVEYTKKADTTWANKVKALPTREEVNDAFAQLNASGEIFTKVSVNLTGLEPGTEYMYYVVSGANKSETRYFKTGSQYFSFIWTSDFHTYYDNKSRITRAEDGINKALALTDGVDFVLSTGDTIAHGGTYKWWNQLSDISFTKNYMFADTLGNHDWMTSKGTTVATGASHIFWGANHNNPKNGYAGQENICYYFYYGDALFISLNTEEFTQGQYNWCEQVLKNSDAQYKFIFQHYQMMGGSGGFNSTGYKRWHELCDKYGVDVAFSGNSHVYVRTKYIYEDKESTNPSQGTVYAVAPSSDGERGEAPKEITSNKDLVEFSWSNKTSTACSIVDVTEEGIRIRLVSNGEVLDNGFYKAKNGSSSRVTKDLTGVDKDAIMNGISFEVRNDDYANPIIKYPASAIEAVRTFKIVDKNDGTVYFSGKPNPDATEIVAEGLPEKKKMNLEISVNFFDNDVKKFEKEYLSGKDFGNIGNVKIATGESGALLTWDETLVASEVDSVQVLVNGREFEKVELGKKQVEIPYIKFDSNKANAVKVNVLSKTNNVYITNDLTYNAPVLAKSIEIECEGESDLFGGEDTKLKVVAEPENAFDSYIWESEDPEVAVVDQEGNVFALNEGVATIKCTSKATKTVYSEFIVTVSGSAGSSLIIKPESKDELNPGDTVQMKIKTALLDDTFTWSSSDTSVATVDENGLVTILKNGKFTITCKSNETLDAVSTYDFTIGKAKGCNAAMSAIFSLWGFVLVGLVKVFVRRKKNIF